MMDKTDKTMGTAAPERTEMREDLDDLVSNMELTLMSIIQGVALFFLTDSSRAPLLAGQIAFLPYIIVGLLVVLLFWSRSLIHTFTLIRWPLEFGHNFGYIACTLIEAIWFTQLNNVRNWYIIGVIYSVAIWLLFTFDMRLIRSRLAESTIPVAKALFVRVEREQLLQVRLAVPAVAFFYVVAAVLAITQPSWFIDQNGHMIFAVLQLGAALFYLGYVLWFFGSIARLIRQYRQETT